MTNFCLLYNSILWFCGEVVAKIIKGARRTTGLGLGEEWGVEPRPSQKAVAISWEQPPPFPKQGLNFQEEVVLQASEPSTVLMPQSSCLLIHWPLVPWDVSALLRITSKLQIK